MTTRRLDGGPLLALAGAALLLIALFLDWYEPRLTAWESFEVWDLVLAAIAVAAVVTAAGMLRGDEPLLERRWLPVLAGVALIVVVSQLLDPPPVTGETDPVEGAWLALGGSLLLVLGALLAVTQISLSFSVETRDRRTRVPAVDARDTPAPDASPAPMTGRKPLFSRAEAPPAEPPAPVEDPVEGEPPQPHGDPVTDDPPTEETARL